MQISCLCSAWIAFTVVVASGRQIVSAQSFHGIGFLPGANASYGAGISPDGSVVVGTSGSLGHRTPAFRYTAAEGMVALDLASEGASASALDASHGGRVIVGARQIPGGVHPWLWDATGQMTDLGSFPDSSIASAFGVSSDGTVVVGVCYGLGGPDRAFRWTREEGLRDLGTLPGGYGAVAQGVSSDGRVVVGFAFGGSGAFRWTAEERMMDFGPTPSLGGAYASATNSDGSVVVGSFDSATGEHPMRWTAQPGMIDLGLPPGWSSGVATGVNADGTVIIGEGRDRTGRNNAFVWTARFGMAEMAAYLVPSQGDTTGWGYLRPLGISDDGRILAGQGTDPCRRDQAWIASIDPNRPPRLACRADFNGDGVVDHADFGAYLSCFFSDPPCLGAEFDGGCATTADDLGDFITAYFAGCP